MKTFEEFGIVLPAYAAHGPQDNIYTTCPKCSPHRRKKNVPCLSINMGKGMWNCHHCGWSGKLQGGESHSSDPYAWLQEDFIVPHWDHKPISGKGLLWLRDERCIPESIIEQEQIGFESVYFPQIEGLHDAIRFPFFKNGKVVNIKSLAYQRMEDGTLQRLMRLEGRAERTFYGIDGCLDYPTWIIVEGEIDRLSVLAAGFPNVASVPDGAPPPKSRNYQSKFDFLEREQSGLDRVQRFILAVDNDPAGEKLQEELSRRLGPERCMTVTFPEGCKDANDVLSTHGAEALANVINGAKELPISGVFEVADFEDRIDALYRSGLQMGPRTGWRELDEYYRVIPGYWTPVTGAPGSGKSEFLDGLLVNLAITHGWRSAIFSPENQPFEIHFEKLASKFVGKPFSDRYKNRERMNEDELLLAKRWVNEYFSFILPEDFEGNTLSSILEKARTLVFRKGIRILVIDPWNRLQHNRSKNQGEHEYIGQQLNPITKFARRYHVHVFVVAHPTKLPRKEDPLTGKIQFVEPDLYHISGSADWFNMADGGLALWKFPDKDRVKVLIRKVKFKHMGHVGSCFMNYDEPTGIFTDKDRYDPPILQLTEEERSLLLSGKPAPKPDKQNIKKKIMEVFGE